MVLIFKIINKYLRDEQEPVFMIHNHEVPSSNLGLATERSLVHSIRLFLLTLCMAFFLYIIYSESRDRYYTGYTGNIETRLE